MSTPINAVYQAAMTAFNEALLSGAGNAGPMKPSRVWSRAFYGFRRSTLDKIEEAAWSGLRLGRPPADDHVRPGNEPHVGLQSKLPTVDCRRSGGRARLLMVMLLVSYSFLVRAEHRP